MNKKITQQIQKIPKKSGIYIFKTKKGEFLYIGKAGNLRNRIRQYFKYKAAAPYLKYLLNDAEKVYFKTTDSEIEALILESRLIKKHQPKYNIMLRDGKQYFFVEITKEEFPKIFITHYPDELGPFTDGTALKIALRLLRRIFPYCACKQKHNNFCLNYHIGNCPGYCCLKENQNAKIKNQNDNSKFKNVYKNNIRTLKDILSGKKKSVIKNLRKELLKLAKKEKFEKAIELRNKIEKLEKIFTNAKIISDANNSNLHANVTNNLIELKKIFKLPNLPKRIEGYDISNIQGKNAVGAMAVFSNGRPDKSEYRKFKIRLKQTPDDVAMLKEVLFRRFNHPEWPFPDLILIDGGIGQLNAAIFAIANIAAFLESSKLKNLPIISLAKGKNEVFSFTPYEAARARSASSLRMGSTLKKPAPLKNLPTETKNLILNIDAEAHRFAISYYRKIHRTVIFR